MHLFAQPNPEKNDKLKRFVAQLLAPGQAGEPGFKDLSTLILSMADIDDVTGCVFLTYRQVIEVIKSLDLLKIFGLQDRAALLQGLDIDKNLPQLKKTHFMSFLFEVRKSDEFFFEDSLGGSS